MLLPQLAVEALQQHRKNQAADRLRAGELWQDHGLVFASAVGTQLDRYNVRRLTTRSHMPKVVRYASNSYASFSMTIRGR